MQGFVWVIFLKKATKALCYPDLQTMDGWFHFFSSKGLGKLQFTSILLTEARICLYNLRMYGHASFSGFYKVSRRLYVTETLDKLNLSGKNIKKMGQTKYGDFPCLE